ncbi:MAG: glycosyltransferase family 2 protein [Planctomycetota bacterium]|nr:glycosyltransferase family 2 protein [Planctomycetota bacterium]
MSRPRVSVAIPVYNGMPFLEEAVESVLAQGFGDLELILADNASDDGTEEACRRYAAEDPRVRYFRHVENMGAAANFNFTVARAQGELFKWAAADDVCGLDWISQSVQALDAAGPETVLAFPWVQWIDEQSSPLESYGPDLPWSQGKPHERLASLLANPVNTHLFKCSPICGLIRLKVLRGTELIGSFGGSDKVTLVELALRGQWTEVPAYHFKRRIHEESSLEANKTPEQLAQWFDPKGGKRYPMPRVTLFQGFLRAIQNAPLGRQERWRCIRVLVRFFRSEWRVLGGEYKIKLREVLKIGR